MKKTNQPCCSWHLFIDATTANISGCQGFSCRISRAQVTDCRFSKLFLGTSYNFSTGLSAVHTESRRYPAIMAKVEGTIKMLNVDTCFPQNFSSPFNLNVDTYVSKNVSSPFNWLRFEINKLKDDMSLFCLVTAILMSWSFFSLLLL